MNVYTHGELLDEEFGQIGTPERDEFESLIRAYELADDEERARLERLFCDDNEIDIIGF